MHWDFYTTSMSDRRPRWMWVREDEHHRVIEHSGRSFASYAACLADALERGYRDTGLETPLEVEA